MAHILKYKGYEGTVDYDPEDKVLRGKILYISDLVNYQSADAAVIENEFKAAVDDYLELCVEIGRKPEKPLSGVFNVRIPPELHKEANSLAFRRNVSLNSIVHRAIADYVETGGRDVDHIARCTSEHVVKSIERSVQASYWSMGSASDSEKFFEKNVQLKSSISAEFVWPH